MFKGIGLNLREKKTYNHHINLPDPFRMLICGSSGSGKTTLELRMLLEPNFINYNNLVMFTTNPKAKDEYQFLYHGYNNKLSKDDLGEMWLAQDELREYNQPIEILTKTFASIKEKEGNLNGQITAHLSDKINEIPLPEDLNKVYGKGESTTIKRDHTVLFDDFGKEDSKIPDIYYTESRHAHCNCMFSIQDYFQAPMPVRVNSNIVVLFQQDPAKLTSIFNSCIGERVMKRNKFITRANFIWTKPHTYIAINKDTKKVYEDIFEILEEEEF
jgi:guanylate kinase